MISLVYKKSFLAVDHVLCIIKAAWVISSTSSIFYYLKGYIFITDHKQNCMSNSVKSRIARTCKHINGANDRWENMMWCVEELDWMFFVGHSSQNWPWFQSLPGWAQPQAAALLHPGVIPNQTHPESAEISPFAEGALLAHRPRQWGALPPGW